MITRKQVRDIRIASLALLLALALALVVCSAISSRRSADTSGNPLSYGYPDKPLENKVMPDDYVSDILFAIGDAGSKYEVGEDFLLFCDGNENINTDGRFLYFAKTMIELMGYSDDIWGDVAGYGFSVLYDLYTGAAEDGSIEVLGDVYDQHKTVVSVSFDGADHRDVTGDADLFLGFGEEGVRFVISGGVKMALAVCADREALAAAEASSDVLLVCTDADGVDAALLAGADAVFVADSECEPHVEAVGGVFVIYGVRSADLADAPVLTVSVSAGIDPVVRYYPIAAADEAEAAAMIDAVNSRSDTALIGYDFKVKRK